jgi:3',5'-cyclic AMP phosphodiesterase CpdA
MKIAILHLSDIHLKKSNNPVVAKFPAIRGVIEAHSADLDACAVVFSGDIAFSGKKAEYAIADDFIKQLRDMFSEMNMRFHLCFLPGNHDCDFEKADKARELVLQGSADRRRGQYR